MSDITEGLGTATEGALVARAVEHEGRGEGPAATQGACLNCGTSLTGAHCHTCGQKGEVHRSLGAVGHEILHGVLHLDGKIWRTLPLLAWKPGKLTRRYIDGERAKFVSPMAMFLFSVFLMFAVFQATGLTTPTDIEADPRKAVKEWTDEQEIRATQRLTEIEAELAGESLSDARRAELQSQRRQIEEDLALLSGETGIAGWLGSGGAEAAPEPEINEEGETVFRMEDGGETSLTVAESDVPFVAKMLEKWRSNPGLMLYKLQANAYKFSWLLIPISLPFVWLLFAWKRRFKAYDHAIFVTYSIAFMSLLFITLSVLGVIGLPNWMLTMAALLIPPLHIYKHLRHTYALSRLGAVWRFVFLIISIGIVVILFLQALLLLGTF